MFQINNGVNQEAHVASCVSAVCIPKTNGSTTSAPKKVRLVSKKKLWRDRNRTCKPGATEPGALESREEWETFKFGSDPSGG